MKNQTALVKDAWEIRHQQGWAGNRPDSTVMRLVRKYRREMGRTIVDIGCGPGRQMIPLIKMGFQVTGIDVTNAAIRQAKARLAGEGLPAAELIQGDFRTVNLNHRQFDCALSVQSLQFGGWSDIRRLFSRVTRHIKPGGLFILRVRSMKFIPRVSHAIKEHHDLPRPERGVTRWRDYETGQRVKFHHYSKAELIHLAQTNGFDILEVPTDQTSSLRLNRRHIVTGQWTTVWRKR